MANAAVLWRVDGKLPAKYGLTSAIGPTEEAQGLKWVASNSEQLLDLECFA